MPAKRRCQLPGEPRCNSAALRIVGDCAHCGSSFCGTVRYAIRLFPAFVLTRRLAAPSTRASCLPQDGRVQTRGVWQKQGETGKRANCCCQDCRMISLRFTKSVSRPLGLPSLCIYQLPILFRLTLYPPTVSPHRTVFFPPYFIVSLLAWLAVLFFFILMVIGYSSSSDVEWVPL